MRTSPSFFWNYPKRDLFLFLRHLRATRHPELRSKDDLTLTMHRPYDNLLAPSCDMVKEVLGQRDKGFARIPSWRLWNESYDALDADFYYHLLRRTRPHRIIEVGGGNSTWFAACATSENDITVTHTVVAPELRTSRLPRGVLHVVSKVEDFPVERFEALEANDILFIDSSHTTAEALYHVREILPRLQSGVIVHHHDIYYPYTIPSYLQPSSEFGENDVVLQFYQEQSESFHILAGLAFARSCMRNEELVKLVPSMQWNLAYYPGALWARKK